MSSAAPHSQSLLEQARVRGPSPVYLVVGEERYLRRMFVEELKRVVLQGAIAGLNEDEWTAADVSPDRVLGVAKTVPMLSPRRWICVTEIERWETKKDNGLTALEAPIPSTVLVLCADKLNARHKLLTHAKKQGYHLACDPLDKRSIPGWLHQEAKRRGCTLDHEAASLIAEVVASDLSVLSDLIERLCLFLGGQGTITEETVGALIPVVRPSTVWELTDAVADRNVARALASLAKVYDPSDRGLRLVSLLLWSTRQLVGFEAARSSGQSPSDAAKAAGLPPFRAGKVESQLRKLQRSELERWFVVLRQVDLALKGGSKRPPLAILEAALLELCRP
jgi:DNA polymerase-3 subunit delta